MRNSNCIAIAPTATIANIVGVSASIEPTYQNLFVKSNLSGEFTVVNDYLVRDLKQRGLWDEVMIADVKYFDGNLARIDGCRPTCAGCMPPPSRSSRSGWSSRRRAAEVDRPVAVAQHLHAGRLWQEAGRDLQARVDPRPEDHLLPAAPWAPPTRRSRPSKAGALNAVPSAEASTVAADAPGAEPKLCSIDNPECEACQ